MACPRIQLVRLKNEALLNRCHGNIVLQHSVCGKEAEPQDGVNDFLKFIKTRKSEWIRYHSSGVFPDVCNACSSWNVKKNNSVNK